MERILIIVGWVIVTLVFIAIHHLYNWAARKIGANELQVPIGIIYFGLNVVYFIFCYHAFKFM